jgi:N-acyl-D-aspartate/D-glutamate deacylase
MKIYPIALLLLPFSALLTNENPEVFPSSYAVSDTTKRSPTAAELKKMKKDLDKSLPKGMSDAIMNTVKNGKDMDFSGSSEAMAKMNYAIEKEEIINDFKDDSFDSAKDKREARKEMKEDLKKLKQDYKKELRESRQEMKEMKAELK